MSLKGHPDHKAKMRAGGPALAFDVCRVCRSYIKVMEDGDRKRGNAQDSFVSFVLF